MIVFSKLKVLMDLKGVKKYDLRKSGVNAQILDKALNGSGNIDTRTINKLCKLLSCQPGDIMEYVPEESDEEFCNTLVQNYESSTDKGEFVSFDEAAKMCDVNIKE